MTRTTVLADNRGSQQPSRIAAPKSIAGCSDSRGSNPSRRTANSALRFQAKWKSIAWSFGIAALWTTSAIAADGLPLHNIDGVICVKATVRAEAGEAPAYLMVDLGSRAPLLLHVRTAALLGISNRGVVDVVPDGTNVVLPKVDTVAQELEQLETLTRTHSERLNEIPIAGILGLPAFRDRLLDLDIQGGKLTLRRRGEREPSIDVGESSEIHAMEFEAIAYGYWLAGDASDNETLRIRFATSEYDTRISGAVAERLQATDGVLRRLLVGTLDLARFAVMRPTDLSVFPDPKPDVVIGTGLLSNFLVRIDPQIQQMWWIPMSEPQLPEEERRFYSARSQGDCDALEAFLREHTNSRFAPEAAEALVYFRAAAQPFDRDALRRALEWRAGTTPKRRRAIALVQVADEFIADENERADAYELAAIALDVGEPFAADDLNATAIHHIHARRGLIALLRTDYNQAHRHLLSASFGLPKDPFVNLWLGRLYEMKGQLPRAWSRYLESALHDDPPIGAFRGLDRLNNDPIFRSTFSMSSAESLLEGRVPVFHPVRRANANAEETGRPVRLVELFSGLAVPDTQAAEQSFDALAAELRRETAFVQYHLGDGLHCALADARRRFYEVKDLPSAFFDGAGPISGGGDDGAASRVYAAYRNQALSGDGGRRGDVLTGRAEIRGDTVQVEIGLKTEGVSDRLAMHIVLCERAVMAIGLNGQVLHHHVARATLEPQGDWRMSGACRAEADIADVQDMIRRELAQLEKNEDGRLVMRSTFIDPLGIDVVVFLQDLDTRRVTDALVLPVSAQSRVTP